MKESELINKPPFSIFLYTVRYFPISLTNMSPDHWKYLPGSYHLQFFASSTVVLLVTVDILITSSDTLLM